MNVRSIMTGGVVMVSADTNLQTAAEAMKSNDVGALPVHEEGVLRGIVTDRDIVIRAVAEGKSPAQTLVSDVMTKQLLTCNENDDVQEVVDLMRSNKVRRVVVLNNDDRPIGIVSLGDIASHAGIRLAAEMVKGVATPAHSK